MAYPSPPEISTSYTAQEQALGDGTLPGQELDVDLASIRASVTAVIEFVKQITRSDGALANGIVTQEALGAALIIGFEPPSVWAAGVAYTTRSIVFDGTRIYLCLAAHTSSVFATDLASGRWSLLADLTPAVGALVASNNLSDLPDKPNARANLGLGSMATAASGTGAAQFRTNLQNEAFFQPLAAGLTSWAAITRASGFDTFAATPSSANLRALLSDETGSGALLFAGGAMGTPSSLDLTNATGLPFGGLAAAAVTTATETIAANNVDTQVPTSAAVKAYVDAQLIPRVLANFTGGTSSTGTYSRAGTTVTVTMTAHGMATGQFVFLDFTTGTATDGYYQVTVVDVNTYTVTDTVSGSTSGNVTRLVWARKSYGVASIVRNGSGDFTITFTSAFADANYVALVTAGGSGVAASGNALVGWGGIYTTSSLRVGISDNNTDSNTDPTYCNVAIWA